MRAEPAEAGFVAETVAETFQHLGVAVWLVPQRSQRRRVLCDVVRLFVEHALEHGEVLLTDDRSAVAVWLPWPRRVPLPPDYERRQAAICGPWTDRFRHYDQLRWAHRPTRPHRYLAFHATDPDRRGEGIGSVLLHHYHDQLDADGVSAYVDACSPPARDLYARHGYVAGPPFALPDGAPLWPMWRDPTP
ncbi:GNAT family N-acetyltransferase [Actinomycetes bacterium KLBMP 9797]